MVKGTEKASGNRKNFLRHMSPVKDPPICIHEWVGAVGAAQFSRYLYPILSIFTSNLDECQRGELELAISYSERATKL